MIIVYSKPDCPHCKLATEYLHQIGLEYTVIDVTTDQDALAFIKAQNHRTVPQLYLNGKLFVEGGNSGLRNLGVEELFTRISNNL